jgi:cyanophycinase
MSIQGAKGILIPIGGNEDKGTGEDDLHTLDFIDEGILQHVVKAAGGEEARIIIIPTASSIPEEVGENYLEAFGKLKCKNVTVLDIRSQEDAAKPEAIELIKNSDCVMFSGGDQSKIVAHLGGSTIHKLLVKKYTNENFVIAGTSAGAMCMSHEMITGGNSSDSLRKGVVMMDKGMNFISEAIIDSHFIRRGRFGRLIESVAKFPQLLGIGLGEDTGIIIKNNNFTVIGSGMVIVFDGHHLHHNNEPILKQGTPMTVTHMITHVLSNGDQYNLTTRLVEALPISSPFV